MPEAGAAHHRQYNTAVFLFVCGGQLKLSTRKTLGPFYQLLACHFSYPPRLAVAKIVQLIKGSAHFDEK
jgi:hypothetical protein